jgi:hypothetical protein
MKRESSTARNSSKMSDRPEALRLAHYFSTSEGFWMGLQADYGLEEARNHPGKRLQQEVRTLLREFCENQCCTVMHNTANWRIGRPSNSLIIKV